MTSRVRVARTYSTGRYPAFGFKLSCANIINWQSVVEYTAIWVGKGQMI
jgi:hypothetical protein